MSILEATIRLEHDPLGCTTMKSVITTGDQTDTQELVFDNPADGLRMAALLRYGWADSLARPEKVG